MDDGAGVEGRCGRYFYGPRIYQSNSSMKLISLNIVAATSLALAALSYALYFDHQRRNDPNFRKLLSTLFCAVNNPFA